MTGEVYSKGNHNKYIPILRRGPGLGDSYVACGTVRST